MHKSTKLPKTIFGIPVVNEMPGKLTARQQHIYKFILSYAEKYGHPPVIRTIADFMGIRSNNGVTCHLYALVSKGWIVPMVYKSKAKGGRSIKSRCYRPRCGWVVRAWPD
jgi:hypothetical protein